jgi:hypothetical protein
VTRQVQIPWFQDPPCLITVAQALVQAAMHTQHHRGQLMTPYFKLVNPQATANGAVLTLAA